MSILHVLQICALFDNSFITSFLWTKNHNYHFCSPPRGPCWPCQFPSIRIHCNFAHTFYVWELYIKWVKLPMCFFFTFLFTLGIFQDMFLGMGQIPVIHNKFWKFCAVDVDISLTFFIDWWDYKFLLTKTRDFNISSQMTGIIYHSSSIYFCSWWHSISLIRALVRER